MSLFEVFPTNRNCRPPSQESKRAFRVAAVLVVVLVLAWAFTSIQLAKSRIDRRLDEATRTGVLR